MENMYPTELSLLIDCFGKMEELQNEVNELKQAIENCDRENISEEILDVMQWCINIAKHFDIDINKAIVEHNFKLIQRGHKFCTIQATNYSVDNQR